MEIKLDDILINALTVLLILVVVAVSKRSTGLAALLVSLPLTTIVSMCLIHSQGKGGEGHLEKLGFFSTATFWYVVPSLPMFLLMPWLFKKGFGFYSALGIGCALTALLYWATVILLRRYAGMPL